MTTETRTYKVVDFNRGPSNARKFGGKFDPVSKTWSIKINHADGFNHWFEAPRNYGLAEVKVEPLNWQKSNGDLADHC